MNRYFAITLLVLLGAADCAESQFYPRPGMVRRRARLQGVWYYQGDHRLPCYLREGPRGSLLLTNEKGEEAQGHVAWGNQIVADDWDGLAGDFRGNVIAWHNGTYWTR